ncbi:sigma-70 family RNA polymerase sigma factor [Pedobacter sp. JY14-1]|uniref:sigma-70 family RNA polymerase sigma factor n=1 Tax=Pedobacter sp. JY14-1 TaxID=3034151 RepID=UPI0023E15846|nr:sigma-70 family RNA polymerase sigma factor [Pedobacter sp. JY14-1]
MNDLLLTDEICSHKSCLETFAMKFTSNVEDAHDLVQDTIIKAIRYHDLYQKGTNMRGWLYTIMKNTFINDYRKMTRKMAVVENCAEFTPEHLRISAEKNQAENKFLMKDINQALASLQPEYSRPFLRYFEGYKYAEIAEELNIPIGTVKTRIHIARQLLKDQLKMYREGYKRKVRV